MARQEVKNGGLNDWENNPVVEGHLDCITEKKGKFGVQRWARFVKRDGETTEVPLTLDLQGKVTSRHQGMYHWVTFLEEKPTPSGSMKVFRVEFDDADLIDGP